MRSVVLRTVVLLCCAVVLPLLWRAYAAQHVPSSLPSVLDMDPIPRTRERLARGKYLVNGVLQCFNCHSDIDWSKRTALPFPGKMGGGHVFDDVELGLPPGSHVVATNISPDPEYGAGKWKDADFVRALRRGIGHDGRTLFPLMPYEYFRHLSDEDLASAVVYIRSIPPVHIRRPTTVLPVQLRNTLQPLPPPDRVAEPDKSNPVKYGEYLVNAGHCNDCHTPTDEHNQPIPDMYLSGGEPLTGPWTGKGPITVSSLNLTPGPSGLAYMNEALFIKTMRTGQVQARQLTNIMPWAWFRNLNDDDLKAMYAYLRTVKPVQHRVDNTEPPGYCKRCRHRHGYGTRNEELAATPPQPAAERH